MTEEAPEKSPEVNYEKSRTAAKRAQLGLNILVVLSALAGSAFFFYVLKTINPWGGGDAPEVNVPTSTVADRLGMLEGENIDAGLFVTLRDIDEAPEYRDNLSEQMRGDLGISKEGRLYLLIVRNHGDTTVEFDANSLQVADKSKQDWKLNWLNEVAEKDNANAAGRMRITQSAHKFELPPGSERQLYVFAQSDSKLPPSAEAFASGVLRLGSGATISLDHVDVKVAEQ